MYALAQKLKSSSPIRSARSTTPGWTDFGHKNEISSNLYLQRTMGNQAMQKRLQATLPHVQAKLTVGLSDDIHEKEADRISEQIIRIPEPQSVMAKTGGKHTQAKGSTGTPPIVTPKMTRNISAMRGGGQPLRESTRQYFEPRFGADLSEVRVHAGQQAADSARAIQARAYTTGKDIFFANGEYSPESIKGKKLLAHELTHVMQQGADNIIQRKPDKSVLAHTTFPIGAEITEEGVGFHQSPVPATGNSDYIRPDFIFGDPITILAKTPMNWFKVQRTHSSIVQEGYVDWRYVNILPIRTPLELHAVNTALSAPWSVAGVKEMLNMTPEGKAALHSLETTIDVVVCDDIQATQLDITVNDPKAVGMTTEQMIKGIIAGTLVNTIVKTHVPQPVANGHSNRKDKKIFIKKTFSNFDAAATIIHESLHVTGPAGMAAKDEEKLIRTTVSTLRAGMETSLGLSEREKQQSVLPSTNQTQEQRETTVNKSKHYNPPSQSLGGHVFKIVKFSPRPVGGVPFTGFKPGSVP